MTNDFKIKLPKDKAKVNTNDFGEFIWWCHHLGVSPEDLLAITTRLGNNVADIRKYIRSN